jgi:hypothetical protein
VTDSLTPNLWQGAICGSTVSEGRRGIRKTVSVVCGFRTRAPLLLRCAAASRASRAVLLAKEWLGKEKAADHSSAAEVREELHASYPAMLDRAVIQSTVTAIFMFGIQGRRRIAATMREPELLVMRMLDGDCRRIGGLPPRTGMLRLVFPAEVEPTWPGS